MNNILHLVNLITNNNYDNLNNLYHNTKTYFYKFYSDIIEEFLINNNIIYLKNEYSNYNLINFINKIINLSNYDYLLFSNSNNVVDFNNINNDNIYYINNKNDNKFDVNLEKQDDELIVIISLSEYSFNNNINLDNVISSLNNQILKPRHIILNILDSNRYVLHFTDSNIIINYGNNILVLDKIINPDDKLIFINDNFIANDDMTLLYKLCYQLYNCEAINVEINFNNNLIYYAQNTIANFNINNSYSFKFSSLNKNKLYTCSINKELGNNINLDISTSFEIYVDNPIIQSNIKQRDLLCNVKNIHYSNIINSENEYKKYVDIKYYNKNTFILTLSYLTENINDIELIEITKDKKINIIIINPNLYNKVTIFVNIDDYNIYKLDDTENESEKDINKYYEIIKLEHTNYNFNLLQVGNNNIQDIYNFNLLMVTINKFPNLNYFYFNFSDIDKYLSSNYTIYNLYNKIKEEYYKIELFKIYYLFNNNGLYIDSTNFINLYEIYSDELFKLEYFNLDNNMFINFMNKHLPLTDNLLLITNYLIKTCYNVLHNILIDNTIINNINCEFIQNINKNIITKNINEIYDINKLDYQKINGIDHIVWINLDKKENRKNYMENLLSNIDIPNTRISAIDAIGNDFSNNNLINKKNTNYETACTLSHIKAISHLKNLNGNYFLVCEDDICLKNLSLFENDIIDIITNAPPFDILLLSKIFYSKLTDLYSKWFSTNGVGGTACYIITKEGVEKNNKIASIDSNNNFIINREITVSDNYIYNFVDTYVYKYDFITVLNEDSTIHPEHLDMQTQLTDIQKVFIIKDFIINDF
jgi:GR25 family glycosyltransferase involved in LPS biosynthesis